MKKMKIRLNQNETYNINIAEEYTASDFSNLLIRLSEIQMLIQSSTEKPEPIFEDPKPIKDFPVTITPELDNPKIKCIHCGSKKVVKDGLYKKFRRYSCKDCNKKFTSGHLTGEIKFQKYKGNKNKKIIKRKQTIFWNDRDEVVELLKTHYYGSKAEKNKFAERKNTDWLNCTKSVSSLRKRYDIQPSEIGLKKFPKRLRRELKNGI